MSVEILPGDLAAGGSGTRILTRVAIALLAMIGWLALLLLTLWLVGRIATDRYHWSQWLWWIPTPAAIAFVVLGLIAAVRPARKPGVRRRRIVRWVAAGAAILIYFAAIEHRMFRFGSERERDSNVISIAHWNPTDFPGRLTVEAVSSQFLALDADITLFTGANHAAHVVRVKQELGGGQNPVSLGGVALLSRFPIVSTRLLAATGGAFISTVTIDTSARLGRPIIVYVVDMPSDPRIGRMALARHLRGLLDDLDASDRPPAPPDVVVGDFNITRGSASIAALFPNYSHAFDKAGRGYGATYHRERPFPLHHIDHTFLSPAMHALRYDIVDTGVARHCAQKTWIAPAATDD